MIRIEYPDRDIKGQLRPEGFGRLNLGTECFQRILKSIRRRRAREPELVEAFNEMEWDLWRKSHNALKRRVRSGPSFEGWKELLASVPKSQRRPSSSRATRRRRSLVLQGLGKSWGTDRPLSVETEKGVICFGSKRWRSPLPKGGELIWRFSPYRLDYYANVKVPAEPRDWIPAPLYKRLVQRGRARPRTKRSPQARSRKKSL